MLTKSKSVVPGKVTDRVTHMNMPLLRAYSGTPAMLKRWPNLKYQWIVPCPFCDRGVHFHGAAEGSRVAHCPDDSHYKRYPEHPQQYILVYDGMATKPVIEAMMKRERLRGKLEKLAATEDQLRAQASERKAEVSVLSGDVSNQKAIEWTKEKEVQTQ